MFGQALRKQFTAMGAEAQVQVGGDRFEIDIDRHNETFALRLPGDGSVQMEDQTYRMGCFVIAGPKARDLLAKVAHADVSNEAFPLSSAREFFIGRIKCRVNRMNYVGELGYEIFHPIESQIPLFKTLMEAGAEFDLKMFGMYAMDSMRLEKGYLAWKAEMNLHHNPLETNIDWTVKWDKEFIGKIIAVNPEIDQTTRSVRVRATLANRDELLRPGMFANVEILLPGDRQMLVIPATAVLYAPYGDTVFVIDEQQDPAADAAQLVLRQQVVRLGETRGDFVAVVEGLREGEQVVTSGVFKLRPKMAVVIDNTLAPEAKLAPSPANK
jgi:hypothetical protein